MLTKLFLSLCLVIGLSAVTVMNAQIASDATLYVNIPHSFIVNNTTLPPGEYTVKVADDYSDLNLLEISSRKGHMSVIFETESVQENHRPNKSELVFDKLGDNYFLSRVFLKGDQYGNELPKSRMMKRMEDRGLKGETYSMPATRKETKQAAKSGA